jgi:putative hydrolase of the HAD superfamily
MPIRAITFDWWGTLFRDAEGQPRQKLRVMAFAKTAGVTPEAVDAALRPVWKAFERSHREHQTTLSATDAVWMTAKELGVSLTDEQAADLAELFAGAVLRYAPVPVDNALEAVRAASARVPVGIISDTGVSPGRMLRQLLDRHGFTPYFKAMTWSDELNGMAKPRAANFECTARALGVQPCDLLHIGDLRYTDIVGANGVGAKSALFTGVSQFPEIREPKSDYEFPSWAQFIEMLPALMQ